jgi:hypothetical protein
MLADKRCHARVDQGLEFDVTDGGKGKVKDIDGIGADRGEIAMKEDEIENA